MERKQLPSRKQREETLKKIKSETQRLRREQELAIPYHRPEQVTLEEFLQRRKRNVISTNADCTPAHVPPSIQAEDEVEEPVPGSSRLEPVPPSALDEEDVLPGSSFNKKSKLRELLQAWKNSNKSSEQSKPMLRRDKNKNFIDLTIDHETATRTPENGKSKPLPKSGIKNLMDRFIKHSILPKKPKEEHFNIHISKKVEDSQGQEHDVVESIDYIAKNDYCDELITSPVTTASPLMLTKKTPPSAKLAHVQEGLKAKILEQKRKAYEEKLRQFAIYNEEKCSEDKDQEEELIEDYEFSSSEGESEPDETDEEALEEYLKEKDKKMKGRKLEFADEEAEVEDDNGELLDLEDDNSELHEVEHEEDEEEISSATSESKQNGIDEDSQDYLQKKRKCRKLELELSDDEDEFEALECDKDEGEILDIEDDSDGESKADDFQVEEDEDLEAKDYKEVCESVKEFKTFKTKAGKIRREYIEDEAELSGSEVGSSDEDERDLDDDDLDLVNDEEAFDNETLRAQIEKHHAKRMIDDDQRDIQQLQDILLPDGDLHDGKVRERQFKWKLLDKEEDDKNAVMDGVGLAEDEDELRWQQEKLEKIKWMKESGLLNCTPNTDEEDIETNLAAIMKQNSQSLSKKTLRKVESFSQESASLLLHESSSSMTMKQKPNNSSQFISSLADDDDELANMPLTFSNISTIARKPLLDIESSPTQTLVSKQRGMKGSFFNLGSPMLNKLAELHKPRETLNGKKGNSRNFVFSVRSPTTSNKVAQLTSDDLGEPAEEQKNKRKSKCPTKFQSKKKAKLESMTLSPSKQASVFKWINA